MRIETHLRRHAADRPDKTALVAGETRLTYGLLDKRVNGLAGALAGLGIGSGDRILFILDNGAEAVMAFQAAWRIGAVACPLHISIKSDKLSGILANTQPKAIIAHSKTAAIVSAAMDGLEVRPLTLLVEAPPHETGLRFEALSALTVELPPSPVLDARDLALLVHTSGSTGSPKGVMHTHASLHAACSAICAYLDNGEDDVVLSVLPLSFGYGITQMVTMMMAGGTLVLERSFAFPRAILARLASENVTGFPVVPAMATMMATMQDLAPDFLPHLRYITSAAAAMPPATTTTLRRLLPDTRLFLMYGQTECIRTAYLSPEDVDAKPLSVGRPLAGTDVALIDDDGRAVRDGQAGELLVTGPHLMAGYWNDKDATEKAFLERDGQRFLRTGDLFSRDEDGCLYFIARRDDMIKTRGEKVSPQEVERALYALPGIREAAVEGVADVIFGQVVKAHVVVDPSAGLTEKLILRHCAQHLEDYMVPKLIAFHDALPRTTTGKIRLSLTQTSTDDTEGKVA